MLVTVWSERMIIVLMVMRGVCLMQLIVPMV
jgi:hypothetical protein